MLPPEAERGVNTVSLGGPMALEVFVTGGEVGLSGSALHQSPAAPPVVGATYPFRTLRSGEWVASKPAPLGLLGISKRRLNAFTALSIAPVFRSTAPAEKHTGGAFIDVHSVKQDAPLQSSGGTSHPKWPGPVFPSLSTFTCVRTPTEPGCILFSNAVVAAASSVLPVVSHGLQMKTGGTLQICSPAFPAIACAPAV